MSIQLALCIAGMALVTALLRIPPITLLAGRQLSPFLLRWLSFVPVAVLSALLIPELVLNHGVLDLTWNNLFLLAALPTLVVVMRTGSFFGAMATGMGFVALARYCLPLYFSI